MTLPAPAHVDLADYTDWYIRNLAFAIDAQLNTVVKLAVLNPVEITTEANGEFTASFPGLGQLVGALIYPAGVFYLTSPITTYPPVPPASTGNVVRTAPAWIGLAYLAPAAARCRVYQPPSNLGDKNGYPQQVSAQPVNAGQKMTVAGVAWATL